MSKVTISFSLDDVTDADLLAWLGRFGRRERSAGIRAALRRDINRPTDLLPEVLTTVQRVECKIDDLHRRGVRLPEETTDDAGPDAMPDDIAAALDGLGL